MYLKKISIKNYGPLSHFEFESNFTDKHEPFPIILMGKNGSGKSLVIANIVDALTELKKRCFTSIKEVNGTSYFKVGKMAYIKTGNNDSAVSVKFSHEDKNFELIDVMVIDKEKYKAEYPELYQTYKADDRFESNGYYKDIRGNNPDSEIYLKSNITYFPIDRFYIPSWYNGQNYVRVNEENSNNNVGVSNNSFIKINVFENIREWLYKLFSIKTKIVLLINPKPQAIEQSDFTQNKINEILRIIFNDRNAHIGDINRKTNQIPVILTDKVIADISMMSSGEIMAFSIFASLVKEYDLGSQKFNGQGICLIDEIDESIHFSMQATILPKLISLFPQIQFIISSHSPLFLHGMTQTFGDNLDIFALPSSERINTIFDFSETNNAFSVFSMTNEELANTIKQLKEELSEYRKSDDIIVFTEGKTDKEYLMHSAKVLSYDFCKSIDWNASEEHYGDMNLMKKVQNLAFLGKKSPKVVAFFDRDNRDVMVKFCGLDELCIIDKRVYCVLMPRPKNRLSGDSFSIEHYFDDNELKITYNGKRMYQFNDFRSDGVTLDGLCECEFIKKHGLIREPHYVLDGSSQQKTLELVTKTNVSLSKNDFCQMAVNGNKPFDILKWDNFKDALDKIDSTLLKIE